MLLTDARKGQSAVAAIEGSRQQWTHNSKRSRRMSMPSLNERAPRFTSFLTLCHPSGAVSRATA
jgi:hypothetical protein